ncbi:hypothetical protein GCM10007938_33700 [Vibrio zhanjiangensis]|uniref:Prepilin-type N-terminal cleavage/methylation domain-containing protein n=1 Tax=Vibrio zhanjiangensis TaxID=1046128 RepID=A0ABQ6F273_9VIBR|nr:type II secretion system protein [Vibrio zhanjiangensis]GLT19588.1 hypothetical protein GCM10007938_33700 [Vibrio zhanjiangensis]
MRRMTNTKGFTLYEVLLVLSIIGGLLAVGVPAVMKGYRFVKIQDYIEHLELVTRQVQSYQFYRVKAQGIDPDPDFRESLQSWPADVNALMNDYSSRFWESCSEEEEAAEICIRPDYVPFSQGRLTLKPVWDTTILPIPQGRYYITVPIGQLPDDGTYGSWKTALLKFPGARVMPNYDIRITVKPLTKTLQYREYLQKDGSTPLDGDWDTGGNYAITNVKDVFVRNYDGSQKGVVSRLTDIYTVAHGTWVQKPKCPINKKIITSLSITEILTDRYHTLTGMQRAYKLNETETHVQVGLDVGAKRNSDGANVALHLGLVTLSLQCK